MKRLIIYSLWLALVAADVALPAVQAAQLYRELEDYASAIEQGDWKAVGSRVDAWLEHEPNSQVAAWLALESSDRLGQEERIWELSRRLQEVGDEPGQDSKAPFHWIRPLIEKSPDNIHVRALLSSAATWSGEPAQAEEHAQWVRERDKSLGLALLGRIAILRGAYREGAEYLSDALAWVERDARLHLEYGLALFLLDSREDAMEAGEEFLKAIQHNRSYAQAYRMLALVRYLTGEEADRVLKPARSCIHYNPDMPGPYFIIGRVLLDQGEAEQAVEEFTKALERGEHAGRAYYFRGRAHALMGRHEEAIRDLARAKGRYMSTHAGLLASAGRTQFHRGRYELAIRDLGKALKKHRDPGDSVLHRLEGSSIDLVETLNYRAAAYGMSGRFEEAVADLDRVIELQPDSAAAHLGRANSYRALGKLEPALKDHERAVELAPDYATVWLNRGITREELKDPEGAFRDYSKAIELDPKETQAWFNRAGIYIDHGQWREAVADYDRVIALDADDPLARRGRGEAFIKGGEYARAAEDLEQATRLDPQDAGAWYNLGVAREEAGQAKAAVEAYHKFLTLAFDPALDEFAKLAEQKVKRLEAETAAPVLDTPVAATPPPPPETTAQASPVPPEGQAEGPRKVACPPSEPGTFCSLEGHKDWVRYVAFHPGGQMLASSGTDGAVKLWDLHSGRELRSRDAPSGFVDEIAFSPGGRLLAGTYNKSVILWDVRTGEEVRRLTGHEKGVYTLSFSPDGSMLASGDSGNGVRLWDPATGRQLQELKGMRLTVETVAFSPDGSLLAAAGFRDPRLLWELPGGRLRVEGIHQSDWKQAAYAALFSRDGRLLLTGCGDERIRLWDSGDGRAVGTIHDPAMGVYSLSLSPDGRLLAVDACGEKFDSSWRPCGRADVQLWAWDGNSQELVRTLSDPEADSTHRVAFSPDGRLLAVAADDWVRIWFVGDVVQAATRTPGAEAAVTQEEGPAHKIARLLVDLYSDNANLRAEAAVALAQFGPRAEAVIPDLKMLAGQDPNAEVRRVATHALEVIGAGQTASVPPSADPLIGTWQSAMTMEGKLYYETLTFSSGGELSAVLSDAGGKAVWQGRGGYGYENSRLTTRFTGDGPKTQSVQWQGTERFAVLRGGGHVIFYRIGR